MSPRDRRPAGRGGIVIAGYGNPLREDDGAGFRVACAARERYRDRPDVEVLVGHQPVPEWAEVLARAAVAYLVDAAPSGGTGAPGGVRLVRLTDGTGNPPSGGPGASPAALPDGHALGPAALLALCRAAYARAPESFLLTVAAERFGFADRLSAAPAVAADEALRLLARLIESEPGAGPGEAPDACA